MSVQLPALQEKKEQGNDPFYVVFPGASAASRHLAEARTTLSDQLEAENIFIPSSISTITDPDASGSCY